MRHHPSNTRCLRAALLVLLLVVLPGCHRPTATSLTFPAERYPAAFDAARQTLREAGFPIERVDARAGVIATGRKETAGLATPWDGEQQTLGQEWQDLLNSQSRRVRVTFGQPGRRSVGGTAESAIRASGDMIASVEVTIDRRRLAGWRPETESIRTSSRWGDPTLGPKNTAGVQHVPLRRDEPFAAVLAERIKRALGKSAKQHAGPTAAERHPAG